MQLRQVNFLRPTRGLGRLAPNVLAIYLRSKFGSEISFSYILLGVGSSFRRLAKEVSAISSGPGHPTQVENTRVEFKPLNELTACGSKVRPHWNGRQRTR